MLHRTVATIIISLVIALVPVAMTSAASAKISGLTISPVRKELTVSAGKTAQGSIEVTNGTKQSVTVKLFAKQFSLNDYDYEYSFSQPKYDWIRIDGESSRTLTPHQTVTVRYTVTVPESAASGGYYYALFVSTDERQGSDSMSFRLQTASLLNVTIGGRGIVKSGLLTNGQVPSWLTDNMVQYSYDIKNTGNVHFGGDTFARLEGPFTSTIVEGLGPVVYPDTVRTIKGSIRSPLLPGVYRLTYGYNIDSPKKVIQQSAYMVFIPPWFIMLIVVLVFASMAKWIKWLRARRRSS